MVDVINEERFMTFNRVGDYTSLASALDAAAGSATTSSRTMFVFKLVAVVEPPSKKQCKVTLVTGGPHG